MLTERFDVVVVRAGPAGAAAAIAARRQGAEVLLLDRADFPRDKPCGDGIAAEAVDVLASIGVHGVTDGYPAIERLRLVAPGGAVVSRALPRAAHTIPRRPAPVRGRLLLAGDALSLTNPFTGEGIFYAVLSGSLAGAAAAAGPGRVADRYRSALRHRLGRHFRHSGVA
ncbi:MAG TPA: FAD-dependent monooxygenase, partial [Actinoplanes sp.]